MLLRISFYFILLTLTLIMLFALVYMRLESFDLIDAVYNSVQVQTLSGIVIIPKTRWTKIVISIQSLIGYMLTAGLIIGTLVQPMHLKQLGMDFLLL